MDLCQSCHSAVRLLFPRAKQDRPPRPEIEWLIPQLDYDTYNDCWICYRLARWLTTHDKAKLNSWLQAPLASTYKYLGLATAKFPFWFKEVISYMLIVQVGHSLPSDHDQGECFELACIDKSTYQTMLTAYQPNDSSPINFKVVRNWISACSIHESCNYQPYTFLPVRLLKISDDGKRAKLILTEAEFGEPTTICYQSQRYVTLSHRWGKMEYKKLYACTLHELQQEIIVSSLPQVFQDAFVVAANIGISLVWIDSLCIMQDEGGDDLKQQCQLMDKIYASAFLNISSTGCKDNTESMLHRRVHSTYPKPQTFRARYNFFPRKRYVVEGHVWIDEIANGPLSARGWVFQERHLARRVLHLGSNVMAWECRELDALETCPQGLPEKIILNSLPKRDLFTILEKAKRGLEGDISHAHSTWRDLVEEYSRCKLTVASDKLLAFKGLAAYFNETFKDEYVAGLWKESLAIDLAWHCAPCSEDEDAVKRAPSWSWASVNKEITLPPDLNFDGTKICIYDVYFDDLVDTIAVEASVEDRKAVSLTGFHFPLECQWQGQKIVSFTIGRQATFPVFTGVPCSTVRIDRSAENFNSYKSLSFLLLAISNSSIHGLVLSPLPGRSRAYQRLGSVAAAITFPFTEINGKKVIDGLAGEWVEHYDPGSWFPWKPRVGPFLYNKSAQLLLSSIRDLSKMTKITIH